MILLVNSLYEDKFRNTSFQDRAVFLPHCLGIDIARNKKSRSQVDSVKEFAVSKGYDPDKIFVVGGGSEIPSLMDGCSAMLGLCCITDAKAYVDAYKAGEIDGCRLPGAVQMCLLDRKGCKDTFVNLDYVFERLYLVPRFVENSVVK